MPASRSSRKPNDGRHRAGSPSATRSPLPACHRQEAMVVAFDIGFSFVYCPVCDRSVWRAPDGRRAQTPEELLRLSWKVRRRQGTGTEG
jgi:hypothetical protein